MKDIIILLRPHQYIKNLFIFAPLIFAFQSINSIILLDIFIAFVLFCLIASSIYVLNDIIDIKEDKQHPTKQFRPLAYGNISKNSAIFLFLFLSSISLFASFVINIELFFAFSIYFILNILYCLKLKHISLLDIFIIATGFVLRLVVGSIVTDIVLSYWIVMITFLLAIFLALAKRRDDVLLSIKGRKTRKNIDGYNLEFINASMVLMAGVVIVSYILYTVSIDVFERLDTHYLYITSVFVILGILRYMQITFVEQQSGSPTKIVLNDRFIQLSVVVWIVSFVGIVRFL